MFTKTVLFVTLFFYSIQNLYAEEADVNSMTCGDIQSAAIRIHAQCNKTRVACDETINQIKLLDCENAFYSDSEQDPLKKEMCKSLYQTISECAFIDGAIIFPVAIRDLWSTYVDKGCNVINGDICSLNIGGVNIYDPCSYNPRIDITTTYDCRLSNPSRINPFPEIDSDPAPLAPPAPTSPEFSSPPANVAPAHIYPTIEVTAIPDPTVPSILIPYGEAFTEMNMQNAKFADYQLSTGNFLNP